MDNASQLIQIPAKVREYLAANIKEGRFLRSLLRLSIEMAKVRSQLSTSGREATYPESHPQAKGGDQ